MQVISPEELKSLAATEASPSVSIYVPIHRAGPDVQQDPIRLKNLLAEAEKRLAANGLRAHDARQLLAPAEDLLARRQQLPPGSDGLAIFLAPDFFRHYWLPFPVAELLMVSRRFHLKPMLPALAPDGVFYVLALSQNQVRLLEGTRHTVHAVELPNAPQSMAEALRYDEHETQTQFHTGTRGSGGQGGERPGAYFGTGTTGDEHRTDLLRYFNQVDAGVRAVLGPSKAPLVVAAVDYLHPLYREANEYPHLLDTGLTGNPDEAKPEDLHAEAWELVRPLFVARRDAYAELFRQLKGNGDGRAATDAETIVPAAHYGRVEALFVLVGQQVWGRFEAGANTAEVHNPPAPEDEDLYDLAAVQAYLNGGHVYAVTADKMPGREPLAAVFRY